MTSKARGLWEVEPRHNQVHFSLEALNAQHVRTHFASHAQPLACGQNLFPAFDSSSSETEFGACDGCLSLWGDTAAGLSNSVPLSTRQQSAVTYRPRTDLLISHLDNEPKI